MVFQDYHVHTVFSDGKSEPEEVAAEAYRRGFAALGFSDHSHTEFDLSYCMRRERYAEYRARIGALKAEYAGKMEIFCGIEQDGFSAEPAEGFDYVIGSLHYLRIGGEYVEVDGSAEILRAAAERHFGGDILSVAECYYETLAAQIGAMQPDIIGHFDLITKFNEGNALFSETDGRYRRAWQAAADALLKLGVPFEVNTGAISRGYRTAPYPGPEIAAYLTEKGGKLLLSSDSHHKDTLGYEFETQSGRRLPWCAWTPEG